MCFPRAKNEESTYLIFINLVDGLLTDEEFHSPNKAERSFDLKQTTLVKILQVYSSMQIRVIFP
jgi:hypothetical protein